MFGFWRHVLQYNVLVLLFHLMCEQAGYINLTWSPTNRLLSEQKTNRTLKLLNKLIWKQIRTPTSQVNLANLHSFTLRSCRRQGSHDGCLEYVFLLQPPLKFSFRVEILTAVPSAITHTDCTVPSTNITDLHSHNPWISFDVGHSWSEDVRILWEPKSSDANSMQFFVHSCWDYIVPSNENSKYTRLVKLHPF